MKLRYVGPHDQVLVPELNVVAESGDEVDASGDVAASLIATGLWEKSNKKSSGDEPDGKE